MKLELNESIYKLQWDIDHYKQYGLDWKEDLIFEDWEEFFDFEYEKAILFKHPNPVIFRGYKPVVEYLDYPETNNYWQVMSKKMYETLLSVGDFPHRIIPVAVVDWTVQPWDWFEETTITRENAYTEGRPSRYKMGRNLKKEVCFGDFLAIQMTEHLDILDYEKSLLYREDEDDPDRITSIERYVFKIPEKGLPPIFKLKTDPFYNFISAVAREALYKAKISGPRFKSLQYPTDYVDVPVVLPDE